MASNSALANMSRMVQNVGSLQAQEVMVVVIVFFFFFLLLLCNEVVSSLEYPNGVE